MSAHVPGARRVAAPKTTKVLAEILCLGVLAQAAFAGAFLGGHHPWLTWHQRLGDFVVIVPIANLIVGMAGRRHLPEPGSMLATRVVLLALVIGTEAAGHAGGSLLALHIPLAVATMALAVWQVTATSEGQRADTRPSSVRARPGSA